MGNPMIYMYICAAGVAFGLVLFAYGLHGHMKYIRTERYRPVWIIGLISTFASVAFMSYPLALMNEAEPQYDGWSTEYAVVEFDEGTAGVKPLIESDGTVHILTCYQQRGHKISRCWSKMMDNVE